MLSGIRIPGSKMLHPESWSIAKTTCERGRLADSTARTAVAHKTRSSLWFCCSSIGLLKASALLFLC